eukprot:UN07932
MEVVSEKFKAARQKFNNDLVNNDNNNDSNGNNNTNMDTYNADHTDPIHNVSKHPGDLIQRSKLKRQLKLTVLDNDIKSKLDDSQMDLAM